MIVVPPRLKSGEKEILIIFHNETAVHAQEMPRSVWVYQSVYGAPAKVRGQAYDDLGFYHRDWGRQTGPAERPMARSLAGRM